MTTTVSTTWALDPAHSHAGFAARHAMVATVRGAITGASGTIVLDDENPAASRVEASLPTATLHTGQEQRDAHLKSPDFLDVDRYPAITFHSHAVEASGADRLRVRGELTIKDVTPEVTLDVEGTPVHRGMDGRPVRGFEASTRLNRSDYGLTWNMAIEGGGLLVSDEIKVTLDLEAVASE